MSLQLTMRHYYEQSGPIVRLWQTFIYVLVFVSILELFMEYDFIKHSYDPLLLKQIDFGIAVIFLVDYLFRFYIAEKKWKFVKNIYNILDIIAILPSFLIFLDGMQILRGARLVRALRTLRLLRFIRITHLIEQRTKPKPKKHIEAETETAFYLKLMAFYQQLKNEENPTSLLKDIRTLFNRLNKEINRSSETSQVNQRHLFAIGFYELARQAYPVIKHLQKNPSTASEQQKLRSILREMGDLLSTECGLSDDHRIDEREMGRAAYLFLLLRSSINDVIFIATIAVCINLFLRAMQWDSHLAPALEYISVVEGILGTLILMMTSFNIRYANDKREKMDHEAMHLMNFLSYYATRIRTLLDTFEDDDKKRKKVAEELKYYFDTIGYGILHSTYAKDAQEVRFDTASVQVLERIRYAIKPYKKQLDTRTFDKYEEMHGNASLYINQLQLQATTGIPTLFNSLNHWLLRATYFTLLVLSPLAAIPRIIIMYIIQRAFFRTSRETDNAILSHSLAKLPLEQRVVRRLCRIGAIFSY